MKLDKTYAREIKNIANGDGSRKARFAFLNLAKEAAKKLSKPNVTEKFNDILREYGRVAVGLCVAVTVKERRDRLDSSTVLWAEQVLALWKNRPYDMSYLAICDNLHPTRIEVYAGPFIRLTTEEETV